MAQQSSTDTGLLVTESWPIERVIPYARNPRKLTDAQVAGVAGSLKQFKFRQPLVVDAEGVLIVGHTRLQAARQLGWTHVPVHVAHDMSPADAMAYRIRDNRSAEDGQWDDDLLTVEVQALIERGYDIAQTGFLTDELDEILARVDKADERDAVPLPAVPSVFDRDTIARRAFEHYRRVGFPYRDLPLWQCMQQINKLAATESDALARTTMAYQVADTYHPHRYHVAAMDKRSPFESFNIDTSLLKVCEHAVDNGLPSIYGFLQLVNGTQACSNFRPGFASLMYRTYAGPGDVVLDTSTGFGGRLVGFMASNLGRYIGIDPNKLTHDANTRMAAELGFADRVELHNLPAEDVPHEVVAGRCDFAFTSPPYFAKERYSEDETQSWKRYPTGDGWRAGFLRPMLALQFAALKPGKYSVVNIADVIVKGTAYPLEAWTVEDAKAVGFEHVKTDRFVMPARMGSPEDDEPATEPVIVLRKPE